MLKRNKYFLNLYCILLFTRRCTRTVPCWSQHQSHTKLFSTTVLPILVYWQLWNLGTVFNCKRILGVHLKSTNINLAVYAGLGRMPLSTQVCSRIAKFWLRQIRLKFSRTKFFKYIMMRMTIDILFIAKNKLVLCVNICVFQISKERSSMKYRKKSKRNGFSNTTTTILKKHLLIKSSLRKSGTHAFTMVIFRRIMTLWESCWTQWELCYTFTVSAVAVSDWTTACGANMSWRDITSTWLTNNSGKEDRLILDLIRYLVERNIIPETLVDNLTLHSILLTQIMLETLNGISVPKAPQGNTFTYHANAKEMMMWELGEKTPSTLNRWKNKQEWIWTIIIN